jgi:hypothetical protein
MREPRHLGTAERLKILSSLLNGEDRSVSPFADAELGALLVHQMRSSVAAALREDAPESDKALSEIDVALSSQGIATFAELFEHPSPPKEVLGEVRRYAKHLMEGGPGMFPTDLARVIYALSELCAAKAGKGSLPSRQGATATHFGRWCLAQGWLDDRTRTIVRQLLD